MIQVPSNTPKTVSFSQSVTNNTTEIAKSQIGKMALAETAARGEKDNADFRLAKATETLRVAELAYRESITKSVWNKEQLRTGYNNAIAEYRSADKAAQAAAESLNLAKAALDGVRAASNGEILKREFSDDKRQELASKGKAMADGSYPIETRADLENAVQSYGRASDPKAVKAHIITQAKALGATDALPESWKAEPSLSTAVPTNKSVLRKDASMPTDSYGYTYAADLGAPLPGNQTNAEFDAQYETVLCPDCLGFDGQEGCPTCGGMAFIGIEKSAYVPAANRFGTDELLTRPFQKSAAYQEYIFSVEKYGVKGRSGAQPGHPFEGNQHTGGMRTFSRGEMAGKREGWKTTVKRYQGIHDTHTALGRKAVEESKALEKQGRFREAADKHEEAFNHFAKAHGALKGIQDKFQKETDRGSHGASQSKVAEFSGKAQALYSGERASAQNETQRLAGMADAAESAAYSAGGQ